MSTSNYNKIISTINSVSSNYSYLPDPNNLICIDTSNNRIGINTLNPTQSIDVSGGTIKANNFMINDISLNVKLNEIIDALNSLSGSINIANIPV